MADPTAPASPTAPAFSIQVPLASVADGYHDDIRGLNGYHITSPSLADGCRLPVENFAPLDTGYHVHDDREALVDPGGQEDSHPGAIIAHVRVPGADPEEGYHCHAPIKPQGSKARNQLIAVSVLCLLFMVAEIVGGLLSNSLALVADATHLASDMTGFLISLVAVWLARKKPTKRLNYGYYRAEVLGALFSVIIIWIMTGVLVYLAVQRIKDDSYKIEPKMMIITASIGVAFNIIMGCTLHSGMCKKCQVESKFGHGHSHGGHGHSHGGHGHSHGNHSNSINGYSEIQGATHLPGDADATPHSNTHQTRNSVISDINMESAEEHTTVTSVGEYAVLAGNNLSDVNCNSDITDGASRGKSSGILEKIIGDPEANINIKAAMAHVLGDLIQSIGVLIAAVIIYVDESKKIADPICTFIFAAIVLFTTVTVLRDIFLILLEAVPREADFTGIAKDLQDIVGVRTAHSIRVWALTLDKTVISAHLAIDDRGDWKDIVEKGTLMLRKKHGAFHSTLQLEPYTEDMSTCEQCLSPGTSPSARRVQHV